MMQGKAETEKCYLIPDIKSQRVFFFIINYSDRAIHSSNLIHATYTSYLLSLRGISGSPSQGDCLSLRWILDLGLSGSEGDE